jgi:hypothetical protein
VTQPLTDATLADLEQLPDLPRVTGRLPGA